MKTQLENLKLQGELQKLKAQGKKIGFVPTMGCLHEGHLSLIRLARKQCDVLVASIFVNPLQFGKNEDFDDYPRELEDDCRKLKQEGVNFLFTPSHRDLYPESFQTVVKAGPLALGLCGAFRPGHFDGVCTVVVKLCQISQCDELWLGEKDFQQLLVLKRCLKDLNFTTQVKSGPTVRESDGLAMSSRNKLLNAHGREIAPRLFHVLRKMQERFREGQNQSSNLVEWGKTEILNAGFDSVQYLEICETQLLKTVSMIEKDHAIFVAAYLQGVRLIDHLELNNF